MLTLSISMLLLLAAPSASVERSREMQINVEEVREALKNNRRGRMSIEPAPNMPPPVGRAVCGRIGLGQRGMPERFVYVRYADACAEARFFSERSSDPDLRKRFERTWTQVGCVGL
jgi:hypothetical protein